MEKKLINEPLEKGKESITYFYTIGHGFSENAHKASVLGRFGTSVEAEDHVELINKEVKKDGGCIALKEEFPFLILEILSILFEKDKDKSGVPYKFYRFDWENTEYVPSDSLDKVVVLDEYKEVSQKFMDKLMNKEN